MRAVAILSYVTLAAEVVKAKADPADIAKGDAIAKAGEATTNAEGALAASSGGAPVVTGGPDVKEGACSTQDPQQQSEADCSADGFTSGYFESSSVRTTQECAQQVRTGSGCDKAKYITFHPGETGYHAGSGICSYYSMCECWGSDTCVKTRAGKTLTTAMKTGEIDDLLAAHPDEIPKGVNAGEDGSAEGENFGEDPNYIKSMQEAMLNDAVEPTQMPLKQIPSAAEGDMEGAPKEQESLNVGETEHSCPDRSHAVFRGEWQCIVKGGLQMNLLGGFMSGVILVAGAVAVKLHFMGAELRSHGIAINPMDSDKGED